MNIKIFFKYVHILDIWFLLLLTFQLLKKKKSVLNYFVFEVTKIWYMKTETFQRKSLYNKNINETLR